MNLSRDFPELNSGQLQMLERYIQQREQQAIQQFKESDQ